MSAAPLRRRRDGSSFASAARFVVAPAVSLPLACVLCACADPPHDSGSGGGSSAASSVASGSHATAGGGGETSLDDILAELRADRGAALLAHAAQTGWPVPLPEGRLFVSTEDDFDRVGGDHDNWTGTRMLQDTGFRWVVLPVLAGERYKLTNGSDWRADPWSRSTVYDDFGEMSVVAPTTAHLDRHFALGDAAMAERTVRVWVPSEAVDRVLYAHDGQNLFEPQAAWGGWHLQDAAEEAGGGMLLVGIDNTPERMDEYTGVPDQIDAQSRAWVGGKGDAYADFLRDTVRPFIRTRYGEPGSVGVIGSSLGGLISLLGADRSPGELAFAASLSGTVGWGSIGAGVHNETMIERFARQTSAVAALYFDSGGQGSCVDSDGDGIEDDDPNATDNYCENRQLHGVLTRVGSPYVEGTNLFYAWQPGAEHNEAAWAARVVEPLRIFAGL